MRRKLVAGNWKMNLTTKEATSTVESFLREVSLHEGLDVAICPSYLCIPKLAELLKGTAVSLGAQDVFWKDAGAFTGRVSPAMLAEFGVAYCIVGHSETRGRFGKLEVPESTLGYFAETDETVNLKIRSLLYHGIAPILCVGETLAEREAGATDSVIQSQLTGALAGLDAVELGSLVVAYEPVWAIGTGKTCETAEAERVCAMIRRAVAASHGAPLADGMRVQYGGSVKASNARELFSQPNIDGGLVGGASLSPEEFCEIVHAAS
jgi:triosephosphate isomerase